MINNERKNIIFISATLMILSILSCSSNIQMIQMIMAFCQQHSTYANSNTAPMPTATTAPMPTATTAPTDNTKM